MSNRWTISRVLALPLRALVLVYRYGISSVLPGTCRFQPTCSAYANEALHVHGAWRGGLLTARRMCRCHPWGGSGFDPVPPVNETEKETPEGSLHRS